MGIATTIVQFCYRVEDSVRYRRIKGFFFDLLENPRSPLRPYFDSFMMLLVLSSVSVLIYEVQADLGPFADAFERVAVSLFVAEYLLRMWVYNSSHAIVIEHYERAEFTGTRFRVGPALGEILRKKWDYATSPLAIVDLLAIIPSYRPIRFLRIFLLFRLFKLFRYARSINAFAGMFSDKRFELTTLAYFMAFLVFAAAAALYFFEARLSGGQIETFFDSIYLALVTVSTVGFGDITPQTTEGRLITMVLILAGLGVIAFFTSVIVSAFGERMHEIRSGRVLAEVERHPGHTVVCGFGRVGEVVCARLARDKERFVVVDPSEPRVALAKKLGYLAIQGLGDSTELLESLGVRSGARRILCLTGDDVVNVYITLTSRYLNPAIEIISRANHRDTGPKLVQAGASHTVTPFQAVGLVAAEYVGQPVAFEAIYGMFAGESAIGLATVSVPAEGCRSYPTVGSVGFARHRVILFGVVSSEDRHSGEAFELENRKFYFNPEPDFELQANDVLVVLGHEYSVRHLREQLERRIRGRGRA